MKWYKKILLVIALFINTKVINASVTANISVSTNNTIIGNSGKATLTINANGEHIGQIYGTFSCGSLGDKDLKYVASEDPPTTKTYTIDWTAKNAGTYTCTVTGLQIGLLEKPSDFTSANITSKTITVTASNNNNSSDSTTKNNTSNSGTTKEKKEYDADNTLKSLEIENYQIDPTFNKDTTEYKLEVDESVEKINIKATANSGKAEVSGIGEKNLSQGENTIEVKVTAENGNEKIYKIIITVKDQHPIEVTIDKKKYTIVKKNNDIIGKLENYEEEVIKIDDQDVISYINKNTKVRLVILKDENNQVGYYIYNAETSKYSKYRTITVGNVTLQLLNAPTKLKYFQKYKIDIKEERVDIYKIKENHKVGLIYGTNVKTGNTGYYVYDISEETLSKYYDEEVKMVNKELLDIKNKAMIFIGIASAIVIVIIIISLCKNKKATKLK